MISLGLTCDQVKINFPVGGSRKMLVDKTGKNNTVRRHVYKKNQSLLSCAGI
jgi:hypothetical protein